MIITVKFKSDFKDDVVYLENSNYKTIFGKTFSEQKGLPWNRGVVKVSFNEATVHRLFSSGNSSEVDKSKIGLSNLTATILGVEKDKEFDLKIEKGNKFSFYWDHPEHYQRVAFKVSLFSFFISSVSLVLSLIGLFK